MKKVGLALIVLATGFIAAPALAAGVDEPTVYVIKKGDTLWGLSDKFLKDPYYWPDLWSRNRTITNPHLLTPGQKVWIYPDRIETVPPPKPAVSEVKPPPPAQPPVEEVEVKEKAFAMASGAEGFLLEKQMKPTGSIISTYQNRQIVGEDDIVYVDVGRVHGVKPGDRFDVFKKAGMISHPITNITLGNKVIPLGTLLISEVEEGVSKAIITKSYQEIGAGSFILPYRDRRREVTLKGAAREISGYIVETHSGNETVATGDVAFLDFGTKQGAEAGNLVYVVRGVEPNQKFIEAPIGKLPDELLGALVIVDARENTSTVLVVKSIDTIYRGDRVELKKSK
jgi:hypothetical protein